MKYQARVTKVVKPGIHTMGVEPLPLPDRVEIIQEGGPEEPCLMYRYTDAGAFCGDTWHESLQHAFSQAEFEYGLSPQDFHVVDPR
jgi:formylmethanofuran dehydrogenase subunit A